MVVSIPSNRVANLPGGKEPPEWMRTTFVDQESPYRDQDKAYVPIGRFGDATELFLCACYDGTPVLEDNGHVYVPVSWLMREYPEFADQLQVLVERVINAHKGTV